MRGEIAFYVVIAIVAYILCSAIGVWAICALLGFEFTWKIWLAALIFFQLCNGLQINTK